MFLTAPKNTVCVKNFIFDTALIIWHKDEYDMSKGRYGSRSNLALGITYDCKNIKEIFEIENNIL